MDHIGRVNEFRWIRVSYWISRLSVHFVSAFHFMGYLWANVSLLMNRFELSEFNHSLREIKSSVFTLINCFREFKNGYDDSLSKMKTKPISVWKGSCIMILIVSVTSQYIVRLTEIPFFYDLLVYFGSHESWIAASFCIIFLCFVVWIVYRIIFDCHWLFYNLRPQSHYLDL